MIINDDVIAELEHFDPSRFEYVLCCRSIKKDALVLPTDEYIYGSCFDYLAQRMWCTLHGKGTWPLFYSQVYDDSIDEYVDIPIDISGLEAGAIFCTGNKATDTATQEKVEELSAIKELDVPNIIFFTAQGEYYMYVPFTHDLKYPPVLQGFMRCLRDFVRQSKKKYWLHTPSGVECTYTQFKDMLLSNLDSLKVDGTYELPKHMYVPKPSTRTKSMNVYSHSCIQCLSILANIAGEKEHGVTATEFNKTKGKAA